MLIHNASTSLANMARKYCILHPLAPPIFVT
jgi:hypothetical protein